jgi:predicted transcriptional regulator
MNQRLNMFIWQEGLDQVMEEVISSKNDIKLFNYIKTSMNKHNKVTINQTKMAKDLGLSRVKVFQFIRQLVEAGFMHKAYAYTYIVNPFILVSTWMKNRRDEIEAAQEYWASIYGIPTKR